MLTLPANNLRNPTNTMTDVFVIRNQQGHYWGKKKEWVDGSEARTVMRAKHQDEAINTLFELSSKDFELRGEIVAAELSERGEPIVESSQIPLPIIPEPEAAPVPEQEPDTEATVQSETSEDARETPEA
jgi:hypothetical protein